MLLFGAGIFTIVAVSLSFADERWLLVPYGWCGLILSMLVGHVSVLGGGVVVGAFGGVSAGAPGADFYVFLGALFCGGGAYLAQKRIGQWPQASAAGAAADVEAQLASLKNMRERSLISDEEYDQKRQELLQRL
jgi:hypothetical protein